MRRPFFKLHGAGNDLIFFDDRLLTFPVDRNRIQRLCHRRYGIGADGLVLIQPSTHADGRIIYFNADGGEASFCGNALRCSALALRACGQDKSEYSIETSKGVMRCIFRGDQVQTTFPVPSMRLRASVILNEMSFDLVEAGVPHAVAIVDNLSSLSVSEIGRMVRFHPKLGSEGANVTFMQRTGPQEISIRTYERGVEGETLSCGSGAIAAACVAGGARLMVKTRGNDQFEIDTATWHLTGPACMVFSGVIDL